ncbi:MAG TPA: inorganic phosphate transporter [Thermoplasmata archaeon]|nr:inorganic phosphate transporter [Thermoplasmata archaeon]
MDALSAELILVAMALSLFFSFWNGFTDAANAIATIVATRTLKPFQAVGLSAVGNFLGLFFGGAVAATIWKGILDNQAVADAASLRGLSISTLGAWLFIGAIVGGLVWDVITWYFGLPCSETHVLIGSLVGVGLYVGGVAAVQLDSVARRVVFPMLYSPLLAFAFAFVFTTLIARAFRKVPPTRINRQFRRAQIVSSLIFSFSHGSQDGQKVVGLLLGLLAFQGPAPSSTPFWIILAVQIAISLGTLLGGWRIVKTMAMKITKLRAYQGFSAETGGAIVLLGTASVGFPVSTTHAINSAIMGAGATTRLSAVRWGVARRIVWTWILTLPMAALFGFLAMVVIGLFL